jgi:hypothetical protein
MTTAPLAVTSNQEHGGRTMSPYAGQILVSQIMPIIAATVPRVVQMVGAEDAEELVQDVTATAAKCVESCERRGKQIIPLGRVLCDPAGEDRPAFVLGRQHGRPVPCCPA